MRDDPDRRIIQNGNLMNQIRDEPGLNCSERKYERTHKRASELQERQNERKQNPNEIRARFSAKLSRQSQSQRIFFFIWLNQILSSYKLHQVHPQPSLSSRKFKFAIRNWCDQQKVLSSSSFQLYQLQTCGIGHLQQEQHSLKCIISRQTARTSHFIRVLTGIFTSVLRATPSRQYPKHPS